MAGPEDFHRFATLLKNKVSIHNSFPHHAQALLETPNNPMGGTE